jgi:hypothetical protein
MKRRARRITFCVTWVVVKIVVTHFKNPMVGNASGASGFTTLPFKTEVSSARCKVVADSNQKRHVILGLLERSETWVNDGLPRPQTLPNFLCCR